MNVVLQFNLVGCRVKKLSLLKFCWNVVIQALSSSYVQLIVRLKSNAFRWGQGSWVSLTEMVCKSRIFAKSQCGAKWSALMLIWSLFWRALAEKSRRLFASNLGAWSIKLCMWFPEKHYQVVREHILSSDIFEEYWIKMLDTSNFLDDLWILWRYYKVGCIFISNNTWHTYLTVTGTYMYQMSKHEIIFTSGPGKIMMESVGSVDTYRFFQDVAEEETTLLCVGQCLSVLEEDRVGEKEVSTPGPFFSGLRWREEP